MQWNQKYDYPKSSRATVDGIRRYLLGETKLPSVTSILDATRSEEDKAALANWRERTGQKEAEAITKAASSRGSQMHNYLESYLLGRENLSFFEDHEQYKLMAKEIIEKGLKNRLDEIWGVECTLYYPEKYAGTAEMVSKAVIVRKPLVTHSTRLKGMFLNMISSLYPLLTFKTNLFS